MRLGGLVAAALFLVACGGAEAGLLPDGGDGGLPGDVHLAVHDELVAGGFGTCDRPNTHDVTVLVRDGYWLESGLQAKIDTVGGATSVHGGPRWFNGDWPDGGNIDRQVYILADGGVTGTLHFSMVNCSYSYTTTGSRL